ncbi:prenyltransferase/squalene oxidase repeat-containing protein [Streptomyces sp. E-08]|uniref:prenyltransferase/squalene oxidase repeat-containing protein n=1 Tax=Streptomyces sp. E-08 TaxID=3404047 RepID=UPI003CEEACA0
MALDAFRTADGGARQGGADLWCTYAAVRTLTWLGEAPDDPEATARFLLSCRNTDGGFAWQKGLPSDVWATYYCTQALKDLGREIPALAPLADWLSSTRHPSGGFAMTPGQEPDVWATYYATRTFAEILGRPVPDGSPLRDWLGALQRPDGGLGWYPGAAESDVRACYYGSMAWRAAFGDTPTVWRESELVGWLGDRQTPDGGFVFDEAATDTCLWATFRAVRAMEALGAKPVRADDCVGWITGRQGPDTAFTRWQDYPHPDVWASFSAVGALGTLGREVPYAAPVLAFLRQCELPEGGFTYRAVEAAGDSLATAALLLTEAAPGGAASPGDRGTAGSSSRGHTDAAARWLRAAHLPYEGGVMYMPGRGAEIRCTLWAVSALSATAPRDATSVDRATGLDRTGGPEQGTDSDRTTGPARITGLDGERLADWLRRLQNADGGFGYWHGRASDIAATASAVEILSVLGRSPDALDTAALHAFLASCRDAAGYRYAPDGKVTCAGTAQALRVLRLLGAHEKAREQSVLLDAFRSRLGGYAATPRGIPDLSSTYQAVLARQTLRLPEDAAHDADVARFLTKVRRDAGLYAWSPLGRRPAGPLAAALGTLLNRPEPLPALNL